MKTYDLIVIGAGRASNLAAKAGKLGKKVAIIEKDRLGGTCANKGCVPSKLLIAYATKIRDFQKSKNHFIDAEITNIDIDKIFKETNNFIQAVEPKYRKKFNENIDVYKGKAKFSSNYIIDINGEQITSSTIVIATGSRPQKVPFEKAWTNEDIFPMLKKIPKSITIVGSGFIACELANFFDAVGIKTKQVVRGKTLLSKEDKDIREIFEKEYLKNIDVQFETVVKEAKYIDNNFELKLEDNNKNITNYKSEALFYATGRISNADTLALENTDIEVDEKGYIKNDKFFQTNVKGIYVIGDAHGKYMLQHAAAYEVNYLEKILYENEKQALNFKYMPHAVFTSPEIASVGITQEEADNLGIEYITTLTDWSASAKALALRVNYQPMTKLIVNPDTYEILGCHLVGFESSSILHQVLAIMHINNDIRHLKNMLYIHPALNEALLPAAVNTVEKIKEYRKNNHLAK